MKVAIVTLIMLASLGAYAASPTPICRNERQCDAMWAAAELAIASVTKMPVRVIDEARIETHPATDASRLTGVVTKIPSGQEGYKIIVDLTCYGATQCDEIARAASDLFNTMVINAGAGLGPLPEPNRLDRNA